MGKHKKEIVKKAKITSDEFDRLLRIIMTKIYVADDRIFRKRMRAAAKIIGHIDPSDVPFIAVALSIQNNGIWSDDGHFKEQIRIRTYTTAEVLGFV